MLLFLTLFHVLRHVIGFNRAQLVRGQGSRRVLQSSTLTSDQATSRSDYSSPNTILERKLGSYERLLSRKVPGSDKVALSHASAAHLSWSINHSDLVAAIAGCVQRYDRAYS